MVRQLLSQERLSLLGVAAIGALLSMLPMVGILGPESALALGLLLPPIGAAVGARQAHRVREAGGTALEALSRALSAAWLLLAVPVLLLGLNGLRTQSCDPLSGIAFMALGPGAGVTLAAVLGACAGLLSPWRRLAALGAAAIPLLALAVELHGLWSTPAVFAYGHFFGYFPGTFYDRNVPVPEAWIWMRGVSACIAIGAWALTCALWSAGERIRLGGLRERPAYTTVALLAGLVGIFGARHEEQWGLSTSADWIASQLGRQVRSERCVLVVPRELAMDRVTRLAEDCDFQLSRLEQDLGVRVQKPVTAYFFRDRAEKRRLMGAGRVYVAKPWRDEVYLQLSSWPHPVLAHELAHVVAGRTGAGPFRIAGVWGGFFPEPTLIEGMAVALAWRPRSGLTAHQWARAARDAEVAPPLRALVGTGFYAHNQQLGYTLTGSFLRFVLETHGAEALRELYATGDVAAATRTSLDDLERAWDAYLSDVPLPESARALAQLRFERPGVFSEVCPHEVERLRLQLHGAIHAGDHTTAVARCRSILEIDPKNAEGRATLIGALARAGDVEAAEQTLEELEGAPDTPRVTLAQARAELADAAWRAGDIARAAAMVRALLAEPQTDSALRLLEVKALALAASPRERRWLRELLVGDGRGGVDSRVAMHAIAQLEQLRADGLAAYLRGRQLHGASRHDLALAALTSALDRGLPLSRLTREALRLRGLSAFAIGDFRQARASFAAFAAHPDATLAQLEVASRWQRRLDHVRGRADGPES